MKKYSFITGRFISKVFAPGLILAVVVFSLFSFTVTKQVGDDLWKQLGITQQQGRDQVKTSFLNNYFDYYAARNAKNIATGNRAAIAKDLISFAKQYLGSASFKSEYDKERIQSKPSAPTRVAKSKEAIRKEKIDETNDLIKKTEEIIKTSTGNMKEAMQEVLDMHKKNLADYKDPNSQMIDIFYQQELAAAGSAEDDYKESMKRWQENYPEDYKQLIKTRLTKYLSIAATVDFNAALTERNGKKKFVKPEYEAKNADWKMIFRAGEEVYRVVKPFAEQWIKEL